MDILEQTSLQNPWWQESGFLPKEINLYHREIFASFWQEVMSLKQTISLSGLRRTGKSTLLKQVVGKMLKNGQNPQNILYFSFDQPMVGEDTETLEKLIAIYLKKIVGIKPYKIRQKLYIFLDEIQLIDFWQDIVKRYYDLNQNFKFIVSGSASLSVGQKGRESLAGRVFDRILPPLSFSEYKAIFGGNDFSSFLSYGQFPELAEIKDGQRRTEYLKEGVIGKVLEVDIVKTFGVRKTLDFERLFWSLLPNSGQIIDSARLMSDLGIKKATLFKYLSILEKTLLVNKVLNLSGSFRSEKRLLRKLYPASSNFLSLLPVPVNIGFSVETYLVSFLKSKEKSLYLYNLRGKEIDFVLPEKRVVLEVKYQEKIRVSDYAFLEKYGREKNFFGMVVTKNYRAEDKKKKLVFVPLDEFEEFWKNFSPR